jgi:hypothetical protein
MLPLPAEGGNAPLIAPRPVPLIRGIFIFTKMAVSLYPQRSWPIFLTNHVPVARCFRSFRNNFGVIMVLTVKIMVVAGE